MSGHFMISPDQLRPYIIPCYALTPEIQAVSCLKKLGSSIR